MQKFMDYLQDKQLKTGCSLVCIWDGGALHASPCL